MHAHNLLEDFGFQHDHLCIYPIPEPLQEIMKTY